MTATSKDKDIKANYYKQEIINIEKMKSELNIEVETTRKYINFTKIENKDIRKLFKCTFWYNLEVENISLIKMLKWVARFEDLNEFIKDYYCNDRYKFKSENYIKMNLNIEEFCINKSMSTLVKSQFINMILDMHKYDNEDSIYTKYYDENISVIDNIEDINKYKNQDVLNLDLTVFKKYKTNATKAKHIDFTNVSNYNIRNEIRESLLYMLEKKYLSLNSIYQCSLIFSDIDYIIRNEYSNVKSLYSIDKYKLYNEVSIYINYNKVSKCKRQWINTTIKTAYNYIENINDKKLGIIENSKDMWKLENIDYRKSSTMITTRSMNFEATNKNFRELSKRYINSMMKVYSIAYVSGEILKGVTIFLNYINSIYPSWKDLKKLSRKDMDKFFIHFNDNYGHLKNKNISYLRCIKKFIEYIQVSEYEEAPVISSYILISKYDIPKEYKSNMGSKYIPEEVIKQLDENIEFLSPTKYIPVVTILLASGWRISDVLNLRYDNCIEKINDETYFLVGDIVKTDVKSHRVPISANVAKVVKAQIDIASSESFKDINKDKLLFCTEKGKRVGLAYSSSNIRRSLNNLSKNRDIMYEGKHYHFTNHQFRHTKAVELIDKGMELVHVQKWLAHRTSNATMHYAEVKEDTLRKSWEECMKNGFYKFSEDNKFEIVNVSDGDENIDLKYISENRDAINVGLGYCIKPKDSECIYSTAPCLTCKNLCVTNEFVEEYEKEIEKTKQLIIQAEALNRKMWIEKNNIILNKLEFISLKLKKF